MNVTLDARNSAGATHDVCVLGLGYVGLPTAAVLATKGMRVFGVDLRPEVVQTIESGKAHIVEPELDALVRAAVQMGTLRVGLTPQPSDTFVICVPTPFAADHAPDLHFVEDATRALAAVIRPGNLVVLESTSPPGTTRDIVSAMLVKHGFRAGQNVFVAHAPERVLPGSVIREVVENERVVGGITEACTERCAQFYESFIRGEVHRASAETAELAKLAENAYRDVNIAFANELANVCNRLGLDAWEVIRLANHHPRVNVLRPGPGVGGHCIAVDPWFIVAVAPHDTPLIRAARAVNDDRPSKIVAQVRVLAARFKAPRIACLGLTYKPDIDDIRESPALAVVRQLHDEHIGELMLVEPHLSDSPMPELPLFTPDNALAHADIAVILVAHRAFRRIRRDVLVRLSVVDTVGLMHG